MKIVPGIISFVVVAVIAMCMYAAHMFLITPDTHANAAAQESGNVSPYAAPIFVTEAGLVAQARDYKLGLYDCTQYAHELFRRYENDGYQPEHCHGIAMWCIDEATDTTEDDCWHEWVKLGPAFAVEPTTGEFIRPEDYWRDYAERDCRSYIW